MTEVQKKNLKKSIFAIDKSSMLRQNDYTKKNRGSRCYTAPVNRKRYKNGCRTEILHYLYIQEKFIKLREKIKNGNKKIIP